MKKKVCLVVFMLFTVLCLPVIAAKSKDWNKKTAGKWIKKNEWAGASGLKVDPTVNAVEFARQYHANKAAWDLVFDWLAKNDPLTCPVGKYILDSLNVSVTITDGPTVHPIQETRWEAHRDKIDLQYVVRGVERMGTAPLAGSSELIPYNPKSDIGFYQPDEKTAHYVDCKSGTFMLFFPTDAHRPGIFVPGNDTVRKIVFKIRAVHY